MGEMVRIVLTVLVLLRPALCELAFVLALWTPGEKAPNRVPYPNDPNDIVKWSRGEGMLTEIGLKRMYELGKWLRERYIVDTTLLSRNYNVHELTVQSAGFVSSIESAQAVVAGLFPDEGNGRWSNYSLGSWQPTPVFVAATSEPDPHLRQPSYPCPTYEHVKENENREFYKQFDEENKKWYKLLEQHTGIIPVDRRAVSMLFGIHDEILHSQPQPDWINEAYDGMTVIEWIREAHRKFTHSKFNSETKARLRKLFKCPYAHKEYLCSAGVLLNDWIEALIGIAHHTLHTRKAIFLSVGTNLLLAMRYAMDIADEELPGPGSLLLLELRLPNRQERVVELYTRNSTGHLFQRRLPTCEHRCPLDKFLSDLRPMRLTVEDLEMMCKKASRSLARNGDTLLVIAFVIASKAVSTRIYH